MQKVKIAKSKIATFGNDPLEVAWKSDGSQILVSGDLLLGFVNRDTWSLSLSRDFGHKKPITCITFINDSIFATAGLDNIIKVWDL